MTFFINIGRWGGFYCNNGRLCIGFIAFTFLPFDIDTCIGGRSDWEKMKKEKLK
jgi:hypothetical protein